MKLELRRLSLATPGAGDARRDWPVRSCLLLRLTDEQGRSGFGEASPLPGYSPDSLDGAEAALRRVAPEALARSLSDRPPPDALAAVAELVPLTAPAARFALETAALDLLGQAGGTPAPVLLGAARDASRPLAQLLGVAGAPELDSNARRAAAAGYRCFKLKLGAAGKLALELQGALKLRAGFGADFQLRLDANQALDGSQVALAWRALEPANVELFEEPGQVPDELSGRLPLALDESLQGLPESEVDAALERTQARCLVLKPTALGGLSRCLRLAERARLRGAGVVVSHCFDGPLALRAAAALALALPAGHAHGLAPHAALQAWQPGDLPIREGRLEAWREPGLGESRSWW